MYDPLIVSVMDDCAREWADEGIEVWLDGKYRLGQTPAQQPKDAVEEVLSVLDRAAANRWDGGHG